MDRYGLQKAGFTHVLNAAHGRWNVDTGPDYYRDMTIEYHGVEADDLPTFDLSVFFYSAAAFIEEALRDDHSKSAQAARRQVHLEGSGGCAPGSHRQCSGLASSCKPTRRWLQFADLPCPIEHTVGRGEWGWAPALTPLQGIGIEGLRDRPFSLSLS